VWRQLGLGVTKIGAGVVISAAVERPEATRPRQMPRFSPAYHFPDSVDRTTCVGIIEVGGARYRRYMGDPQSLVRRALGPCAFYAAFGKPSPRLERWLSARRYDVALDATWDRRSTRPINESFMNFDALSRYRWMWRWLYQAPPTTVGCIAGRARACAAFMTASAGGTGPSTVVATNFERRGPPLPGATQLLSDALREFGSARFARFWTSDKRVDSAFAIAMDTALGDWMAARQATFTPRLPLGPSVSLSASVLGLLVAALSLGFAAYIAMRRSVA
jgi:hypothetical protein